MLNLQHANASSSAVYVLVNKLISNPIRCFTNSTNPNSLFK